MPQKSANWKRRLKAETEKQRLRDDNIIRGIAAKTTTARSKKAKETARKTTRNTIKLDWKLNLLSIETMTHFSYTAFRI